MNSKRGIQQYFQTARAHAKVDMDPHHRGCYLILGAWPRLMGFPVPELDWKVQFPEHLCSKC